MKKKFVASVAGIACAAGVSASTVVVAPTASAAVSSCSSTLANIYNAPGSVTAANGTLLACAQVKVNSGLIKTANTAYAVQYASTDNNGQRIAVSGLIIVPTAAWTGSGSRPIVSFNPGTLGLGTQCSFSKQLTGTTQGQYESDNIDSLLKAGVAVAATDGVGYLNGQVHPYVVGANAGHAMLDIARTASQVPGAGLSSSAKVGLTGYSEGGQASLWATQLAASYAPDLNIAGAAAGGVPGDLKVTATGLNGGPFFGFLFDAVVGITTSHPSFPVTSYANSSWSSAVKTAKSACLWQTISSFAFGKVENYTTNKLSLAQLYNIADPTGYTVGQFLDEQKLGVNIGKPGSGAKYTIGFPVFQYRGIAEEVIPTSTEDATAKAYCNAGITSVVNRGYAGEHLTADGAAKDDVTKFLVDRFNGKSVNTAGCNF